MCFELDTGVMLIGILHLNAFIYFFMKWTTFASYESWLNLLVSFVYMARTGVFFYGCIKDDYFATVKSRDLYHKVNWISSIALAVIIVLELILYWVNWGHFPVLNFLGWLVLAAFNVYHLIVLRSFANFEESGENIKTPMSSEQYAEYTNSNNSLLNEKSQDSVGRSQEPSPAYSIQ